LHKFKVLELVEKQGKKRIGLFGLAFKKGTDDLRYSPSVDNPVSDLKEGLANIDTAIDFYTKAADNIDNSTEGSNG